MEVLRVLFRDLFEDLVVASKALEVAGGHSDEILDFFVVTLL